MKGLVFSDQMVKAWLAGNKKVSRRLMNPQPSEIETLYPVGPHAPIWMDGMKMIKPRYLPGETVYIKETWRCDNPAAAQDVYSPGIGLFYKAGISEEELAMMPTNSWKSPRFMPEWASRSHALIVSVRPERIQKITEEEAIKEGISKLPFYRLLDQRQTDDRHHRIMGDFPPYYARKFQSLWESLHPGSWKKNDWVWRIELEMVGE